MLGADTAGKDDIALAQAGDTTAFERIMRTYEQKVYNLALRMTGSEADAFDVAQDTFIRVYTSLKGFKGDSVFSTWLHRITTNIALDFLRKRKRRQDHEEPMETDPETGFPLHEVPDMRYSPETAMETTEFRDAVQEALLEISPDHRQILLLREISGLSYAEIADTLSLETGTVKSRIARAREQLRIKLQHLLS